METQIVQPDQTGRYTVMLGSTSSYGLPADIFVAGEAHWLGVQPQGQAEQPRILLLSVPYALKAADAETIRGLPPSAFVLATRANVTGSGAAGSNELAQVLATTITPVTTAGGTIKHLAKFAASADIADSQVFDNGTNVGIGTTTPSTKLDVEGSGTIRGSLNLPSAESATATGGKNSQPLNLAASAFNSSTSAAVSQTFRWQAEPAGNDTAKPSGTLNLLFGSGSTTPAETGLSISNTGEFNFAPGQTFPGAGTIKGVTAGSGLAGGGTNGTVNLGLVTNCAASQVLRWNGSAWICSNAGTGTITGVTAGTDLLGGGSSGNLTLNLDITKVPQLNTANRFTGNQNITGNLSDTGNISATGSVSGQTGSFTANNNTQVVNVTQQGSGLALNGTVAGGTAIKGSATNATGAAIGVFGASASSSGAGVSGHATATSSGGIGVNGTEASPTGSGAKARWRAMMKRCNGLPRSKICSRDGTSTDRSSSCA